MNTTKSVPWVEKYRPNNFDNIVLSDYKRTFFSNIISKKSYFPNMIFFGPPGTGKTTTIINTLQFFRRLGAKNCGVWGHRGLCLFLLYDFGNVTLPVSTHATMFFFRRETFHGLSNK